MRVTVDGSAVEVEPGTTVLEAAGAAGAAVPTLCFDERMAPFGACRVCLVGVSGPDGRAGVVASCTTPCRDGLVVDTRDPAARRAAGSVVELARHALLRDFRRIDPAKARVILVEGGPRLLATFPESLSTYARTALEKLGVTVITGATVEAIAPHAVTIGGEVVPAGCIIWGAGVRASPAAQFLGVPVDRAGRVTVGADLAVPA